MPTYTEPANTLDSIFIKVRRLTRKPSPNQLSDQEISDYVNRSVLYDFPEHLRLKSLLTTITWYTAANQDTYPTDATLPKTDPLYNFKNRYVTLDTPLYIEGFRTFYTQSRDVFFGAFPNNSFKNTFAYGNGTTTLFTGTLNNFPVQQNSILFSSLVVIAGSQQSIGYKDVPTIGSVQDGVLLNVSTGVPVGAINYLTGQFAINFEYPPISGANIVSQSIGYTPAQPTGVLYYQNQFIVRPIPDGVYSVNMEAYIRPTELLTSGSSPELEQWWEYIAYLAAKKVFEDYQDTDSIAKIMPALKEQQALVIRKTVVQNATQRNATIYSPQLDGNPYFGVWGYWQGPIG